MFLRDLGEIGELHLLQHADVERLGGLRLIAPAHLLRSGSGFFGCVVGDVDDRLGRFRGLRFWRRFDNCSRRFFFDRSRRGRLFRFRFARGLADRLLSLFNLLDGGGLGYGDVRFVFEFSFGHWLNLVD